MWRVIVGFAILLLGLLCFIAGIYYSWIVGATSLGSEINDRYLIISKSFGYLSYILIIGGALSIYFSIRKINKEDRKKLLDTKDGQ